MEVNRKKSGVFSLYITFIWASIKAYLRTPAALFFTIFFPVMFVVVFGFLNFGSGDSTSIVAPPNVGVINHSAHPVAGVLVDSIRAQSGAVLDEVSVLDTDENEEDWLNQNDNFLLVYSIPENFGDPSIKSAVSIYGRSGASFDPGYIVADAFLDALLEGVFREAKNTPFDLISQNFWNVEMRTISSSSDSEPSEGFSYRTFLVPGIVAMAVMQTAVFGTAVTLVRMKAQSVLRRMRVTPAGAKPILAAQMVSTIMAVFLSVVFVVGVSAALFSDVREVVLGKPFVFWPYFFLVATLGATVFTALGLVVSGRVSRENVAIPIVNILTFPMLFLTGVFFPVTALPEPIVAIVRFLPLRFLVNAFSELVQQEPSFAAIGWDVLGLAVWAVGLFALSVLLFRWE